MMSAGDTRAFEEKATGCLELSGGCDLENMAERPLSPDPHVRVHIAVAGL